MSHLAQSSRSLLAAALAATVIPAVAGAPAAYAGPQCNRADHPHYSPQHNHTHFWYHSHTIVSGTARYEVYYTSPHDYFRSTSNCNDAVAAVLNDGTDLFAVD